MTARDDQVIEDFELRPLVNDHCPQDEALNKPNTEQDSFECTTAGAPARGLDGMELAILVGQIVRQDEAALSALYGALGRRVYAVAFQITGQTASADEVMQDTFWQVWRQAHRFDPLRGSVTAWVMTVTRSRALDFRRNQTKSALLCHPGEFDGPDIVPVDTAADPLNQLDLVQRSRELHFALAQLAPLKRQLITLVFFRGMTHEDVAAHIDLPLGTVKSYLRRSLSALKCELDPVNFDKCQGRFID